MAIGERRAGAIHRDHEVLLRDLRRDQLDHRLVDLEVPEIDERDAVLLREELGDLVFLDEPELHQIEAEAPPFFF